MINADLKTVNYGHIRDMVTHEIWQKGLSYFHNNNVLSINIKENVLSAIVRGHNKKPYEVNIFQNSDKITTMKCTCSYSSEWGWICKHEVAALLVWIHKREDLYKQNKKSLPSLSVMRDISKNPGYSIFVSWFSSLDQISLSVDLLNDGPSIEITLQDKSSGRTARLTVPPHESPDLLRQLCLSPDINISERASSVTFTDKPIRYELLADFDSGNRLILTPVYRIMSDHNEIILNADQVKSHIINDKWFWYNNSFIRIQGLPDTLMPYFKGEQPLIYEGEEIINFFRYNIISLEQEKRFKPSEQVKKSRILTGSKLSRLRVEDASDWIYLSPYYEVSGINLSLGEILKQKDKNGFVRYKDDWLYFSDDILTGFTKKGNMTDDGRIKLSRLDYIRLKTEMDKTDIEEPEPLNKFYYELNRISEPSPAPEEKDIGMIGELRSYQMAGYNWLWFLYKNNLNGVLADEMGLGKTHQAMALLAALYKAGSTLPSIIISPTSVIDHWENKLQKYLPWIRINKYYGKNRVITADSSYDILLTTYTVMINDIEKLSKPEWQYVILDEAQKIKNHQTKTFKSVKSFNARHKLALTGTPIENRLSELWSIFDFLLPGYLGSIEGFIKEYDTPITKDGNQDKKELLKKIIHPFKLRRLKETVLKELPPKVEDLRYCTLTPHQVAIYKGFIDAQGSKIIKNLQDETKPVDYMHIFALITKLKRLCDHPNLIIDDQAIPATSGKFELFKEIMEEALDSGKKIAVFSQYLEMLDIIERWLSKKRVSFVSLRGSTRNRSNVIKKFQEDPRYTVFVGSLLAGGIGIDLTAASIVIHYDRWWNAARENQATDRLHRIGQKNSVQVFKLITRGTLEEKINNIINKKAELMNSVVESDDTGIAKSLSRKEIIELLSLPVS